MGSLLDLGMSLPSTAGHSDHEMSPKHGQICGKEGALLTESWPLPPASTKIKSWPLDGHGFGWTPGVGDGQGGLACCGSWGPRELDTTEWLNWTRCWPSTYPWKELSVETKNKALCALGKTQKNSPSASQMFLGKDFYESKFLHLLIPR